MGTGKSSLPFEYLGFTYSIMKPIRIWKNLDLDEVKKHLMVIEDAYGFCFSCKKLGLNYVNDKTCPQCNTIFKYVSSNLRGTSNSLKIVKRITDNGLSLSLIEKADFEQSDAKSTIDDLFG